MREIKFRVWDIDNNEMIYSVDEDHDDNNIVILGKIVTRTINGGLAVIRFREDIDPDKGVHWAAPDQVIMQYTGLKDKNGKEIYEGDIVKTRFEVINEILYKNGAFVIFNRGFGSWANFDSNNGMEGEIEIIGNIYENPNLLQKTNEDNKTK